MNVKIASWLAALALVAAPLTDHALGKNEKGCLVGGAAGGVGGHLLGNHALLGAAAGCAVGTYVARDKALKERQAEERRHHPHAKSSHTTAKQREAAREAARGENPGT